MAGLRWCGFVLGSSARWGLLLLVAVLKDDRDGREDGNGGSGVGFGIGVGIEQGCVAMMIEVAKKCRQLNRLDVVHLLQIIDSGVAPSI